MLRTWTAAVAGLTMLGVAGTAEAIPMTYAFDMPAFTGGGFAGQTSILEVTLDNGGTSAANQFYFSFAIQAVASTVGGETLSLGESSADGASYFGDLLYITTDTLGIPTLDLTTTRQSQVSFNNPSGDRISLATADYLSHPTYSVVIDGVEGTLQAADLRVIGRQVVEIPEAPSLVLFVLGLAGLVLLRRGPWPRRHPARQVSAGAFST